MKSVFDDIDKKEKKKGSLFNKIKGSIKKEAGKFKEKHKTVLPSPIRSNSQALGVVGKSLVKQKEAISKTFIGKEPKKMQLGKIPPRYRI